MARVIIDECGLVKEPCVDCDKCYVDDLYDEWHCDEKECLHKAETDKSESDVENIDELIKKDMEEQIKKLYMRLFEKIIS